MNNSLTKYMKYLILAALIYMPVFGHLNTFPIRIWDEARAAMNAYEMLNDGDYIVTHIDGSPDLWSTKPPLLIWCQVGFMKMMGVNELAVRLPSAFAAFLTCLALLIFSLRYLKIFWFGFIAILVLITSNGYIISHAARTGDYDALLTLFTTLGGLFFFLYCEKDRNKYLYLFFAATALAILTKSISGLMFLPAMVIYSVIQKKFIPLLKNKHFYIGIFCCMAVVSAYYILREVKNPGYLAAVWQNELGTRYLEVIEMHNHSFTYYYQNLIDHRFSPWYILIPFGLVTGFMSRDNKVQRITLFTLLMVLVYFLVISTSRTKLAWYDVPLYPYLSILTAVFIYSVLEQTNKFEWRGHRLLQRIIPTVFLFLLLFAPYREMFNKTYLPKEQSDERDFYEIGYYLKGAVKGKYDVNGQYLAYDGYNLHNLFYLKLLNEKGVQISFKDWKTLVAEDVVFAHQWNVKDYIEANYLYELLAREGNVETFRILGRKQ